MALDRSHLLFGPRPGPIGLDRTPTREVSGTHLRTSYPGTWQRDPGITFVKTQDWGHPGGVGAGGSPFGAGVTRRATSLSTARRSITPEPVGTQQRGRILRTGGVPSRYAPKRLWDYQLANIAPAHTTLGRMRRLFSGFRSTLPRA